MSGPSGGRPDIRPFKILERFNVETLLFLFLFFAVVFLVAASVSE